MIQLCCKVSWINNFERRSFSCICLEDNYEKSFEIHADMIFVQFTMIPEQRQGAVSNSCKPISRTAALICMCDILLRRVTTMAPDERVPLR